VFDRSARDAEHLQNFLFVANPGFSGRFPASGQLFGILLPNAAPTVVRAALCGERFVGTTIMVPTDLSPPLALRAAETAKTLGISPRLLWQLTKDGRIPCVRVGSGKRKTVLYPVAALQDWLARQTAKPEGMEGRSND
jgi:predicted DNA-binding transcriptional regulator AlpA